MLKLKKTFFLLITCYTFSGLLLAQDANTTETAKETIDSLDTKKRKKRRKKRKQEVASKVVVPEVKAPVTEAVIQDSIAIKTLQKIDRTAVPEPVTQKKLNLESVRISSDFENGLEDHPSLVELDDRWKQELFNNTLFDSMYVAVNNIDYSKIEYVPNLSTALLKERLAELNARTPFNVEYNPALESVIKSYLKKRHQSMTRLMALSDYYFPLFEQVLDKYDLPLEIKYLAIVESALKPRAKSRVGATGLWQFMFGTGKEYNLGVSSYVDERMDPIRATEAAAQYLARLYKIFGDWDLALASYNSGPGNVTKAIRRSGGYTNYWNIRPFLPRETAGYLPAFLATMYIFEFADQHDFEPKRVEKAYFATDTVRVKKMISFDQIAEITDVKVEVLQFLNPQYKLDIVPHIKNKDYTLRLPLENVGNFVMHEEAIYAKATADFDKREKPLPQLFDAKSKVRYRIRSGDYLGLIARKFGVRVSQIKKWNGLRNNNIRVGKYLTIYPRRPANYASTKSKAVANAKSTGNTKTYTVRSGDSLWSIAQKHPGVSVANLQQWNKVSGSKLKPGMVLKLKN